MTMGQRIAEDRNTTVQPAKMYCPRAFVFQEGQWFLNSEHMTPLGAVETSQECHRILKKNHPPYTVYRTVVLVGCHSQQLSMAKELPIKKVWK